MLALALALLVQVAPTSMLVRPLELGAEIPETRAVALLRVRVEDPAASETSAQVAERLLASVRPDGFVAFVADCEKRPVRDVRAALGTYARSMLDPAVAEAVFEGESSYAGPLTGSDGGVYYVRRIERDAACRQVLVAGTDAAARQRAEALVRELRAGADFVALVRERSDDRASALRNGDLAIYERGRRDVLLRAAAFGARVGEIVGPIETPLGFHVLQRVGVAALAPSLRDDSWARVRSILVMFSGAPGAGAGVEREHDAAETLAAELATRIARGEDMAALAAQHDDDRGGRERRGDLGWVRRATTEMPQFFDALFTQPPGSLIGPIATRTGFVLLRREDPGPRTRVDLRRGALAELDQWVASTDAEAAEVDAARTVARAARRALEAEPAVLRALEAAVASLGTTTDLAAWSAQRPEAERERAGLYARALAALEPEFLAQRWPERGRKVESAFAELRERQVAVFDAALDAGLRELRLADPRVVLRVALVTQCARGSAGSTRTFLSVSDVPAMFDELLANALFSALFDTRASSPVASSLRTAFGPRAGEVLDALVRAQSASLVRRALSAGYRPAPVSDPIAARAAELWLGHVERGEPLEATLAALVALAR